jgi:phage gp16-like protein
MQNKCQNAREAYEAVAQNESVPNDVKSNVYKQLGKFNSHNKWHHSMYQAIQVSIEVSTAAGVKSSQ